MGTAYKHSRRPNLTRKKLREYSYSLARLYLPKKLEDYLLDVFNEEDFLDNEGNIRNYSEEDIWYNIQHPIMEYAQIKKKMDDLLSNSEHLGNFPLTISVNNNKDILLRLEAVDAKAVKLNTIVGENDEDDDIPF